jgi:hypothetical protein
MPDGASVCTRLSRHAVASSTEEALATPGHRRLGWGFPPHGRWGNGDSGRCGGRAVVDVRPHVRCIHGGDAPPSELSGKRARRLQGACVIPRRGFSSLHNFQASNRHARRGGVTVPLSGSGRVAMALRYGDERMEEWSAPLRATPAERSTASSTQGAQALLVCALFRW